MTDIASTTDVTWRKSSYSNGDGGDCVEVAVPMEGLLVRDSKRPAGPVVTVGAEAWGVFLAEVRSRAASWGLVP